MRFNILIWIFFFQHWNKNYIFLSFYHQNSFSQDVRPSCHTLEISFHLGNPSTSFFYTLDSKDFPTKFSSCIHNEFDVYISVLCTWEGWWVVFWRSLVYYPYWGRVYKKYQLPSIALPLQKKTRSLKHRKVQKKGSTIAQLRTEMLKSKNKTMHTRHKPKLECEVTIAY
jgi:hypothetical protein